MKSIICCLLILLVTSAASADEYYQEYDEYNPCNNMVVRVGTDTLIAAAAGALIGRQRGAQVGAGAGLAGSYAIRSSECRAYQRRQEALRQREEARARAIADRDYQEAMRNAPRVTTTANRVQKYVDPNGAVVTQQDNYQVTEGGRPGWVRY
ncbi:MAG: hypothetical protein A3E38_02015 [Candidatus Moranbacteria bacterium RIFCSPHIGHO2_12_FULL_54_9]|nr:MAG: hypothetical protein A3E38_02015 [Candidatus Moranbacteria bacterium RIFCSPHIGHO2_12_FULL_54_9]